MVVKTSRTFVYGHFNWPHKRLEPEPPPGRDDIAIEVLREYSANEFVGKLYHKLISIRDWVPINPSEGSKREWYKWFVKEKRRLVFLMEGSGAWEVQNFRTESDESGPYLAVALKYSAQGISGKSFRLPG